MNPNPPSAYQRVCRLMPSAASAAVVLAALVVLCGWWMERSVWRGQIGAAAPMMPVSAVTFIVAAAALFLLRDESRGARLRLGGALAVVVVASGLLNRVEYLAGATFGLDRLLVADRFAAEGASYPWRMSAGTGLSFILIGTALFGLANPVLRRLAPSLALAVAAISMMVLISLAYGVVPGAAPASKPMSIPSAILLQALAVGVLCARPAWEPIAMLGRSGPGSVLARRLIPAALLILPFLGWLRMVGGRLGLYGHDFGIALFVVVTAAMVSGVVWHTAGVLDRMDAARVTAEQELRTQREQLQAIFDNTSYVMFIKDLEGRYLLVNREFERVTGLTRQTAVGRTVFDLVPPEAAESIWARERQALQTGGPVTFEAESSPLNDGMHTWLITTCPLTDARGEPTGVCGIVSDISERKRAEEDLRRAKEATETANRELEAFAYSVSHDLRAPLRHVSGFVELLENHAGAALDETGRKHLQRISAAAGRMGALIDDLLSFSRMGRTEMQRSTVDLGRLVDDVRREVEQGAAGRRIVWGVGRLPSVQGDPAMLRLVLTNLLSNAVKYTAPRPEARIEVQATRAGGETVISVRDNGVGFDPRYASKLFGVFQRLHHQDQFEGTGIGLANVRRIVERHGGRTWAEAQPDKGASFHFSLPEREEKAA
ncbi:MAG TPA: ATP-binding protein [Patescibacteria group bacterium]|nr:ATP-binding protein [Patescibacteria group bacterium]